MNSGFYDRVNSYRDFLLFRQFSPSEWSHFRSIHPDEANECAHCATRFGYADSSARSVMRGLLQRMPGTILLQRRNGLPMELASLTWEDRARPTTRTRILLRRICDARGAIVWHRHRRTIGGPWGSGLDAVDLSSGPKGQRSLAQGNALGKGDHPPMSPERAVQHSAIACVALSGLDILFVPTNPERCPGLCCDAPLGRNAVPSMTPHTASLNPIGPFF